MHNKCLRLNTKASKTCSFFTLPSLLSLFLLIVPSALQAAVETSVSADVASALQQKSPVSGVVTASDGEPLIGVTVTVKGNTSYGAITDLDGKFTIEAGNTDVLEFRYMGFLTTEVSVGNQKTLKVTMKDDTQTLGEVVIVGYAKVAKASLTGAVDQIRGDVLENRPVVTVAQALQGTVANLNIVSSSGGAPGAGQSINIRGYTGFGSAGSPLIVVDGVQSAAGLRDINPDDIESISVLKDAAASAIYGSSAPYGVIIINTKKGQKGTAPKITYSNNFGFAKPINLPQMMNSLEFAQLYNEAAVNAGNAKLFSDETIQRIKDYQSGKMKDQTIADPNPGTDEWYSWSTSNANNDWFDVYFKDFSFEQKHNIGVSGGSDNSNYYVGLGYTDKDGMYNYGKDKFQRFNIRSNISSELTKWLTFNFRGNYSRSLDDSPATYDARTGGNYMHQIARKWPTVPTVNPDGNYSLYSDILLHNSGARRKYITDRAQITGEVLVTPLEGWDITLNYTFDALFENYQGHSATVYETLPSGKRSPVSGTTPSSFSRSYLKNEHHVINAFTSYEKKLGRHYLKGLIGYTQEFYNDMSFSGSNSYLYTDDIPSLALTYGTSPSTTDALSQLAIRGIFGRVNYNFDEKYLLEATFRYDGSSKYLQDVRYKFYPGFSAAWVISKEEFWESFSPYVNMFKLRGSFGSLGDQGAVDKGRYQFYPSLGTTRPTSTNWIFGGGREAYVTPAGLINPYLTWITTQTYDIGLDMEFLDHRLSATFDWYTRKATDFAVSPTASLPAVLGTKAPNINNAAMKTTGFELTLGWRDRIGDIGYGVRATLSDYQGECTHYDNPNGSLDVWRKGQKMGEIWGYESHGLFQSEEEIAAAADQSKIDANKWMPGDVRYVDRNKDGKIDAGKSTFDDPGDRTVIGNSTPRYQYGFTLDADYKGFDFNIFFQGVGKRDMFVGGNYFFGISGDEWQSSLFTVHRDRWTPENPGGFFPRYYLSSQMNKNMKTQSRYMQDASYLRIKNVQVGYSLPETWMKSIGFERVRVYVSVENLATFTKLMEVMDPEFGDNPKIYPLQQTFSGGVSVTF